MTEIVTYCGDKSDPEFFHKLIDSQHLMLTDVEYDSSNGIIDVVFSEPRLDCNQQTQLIQLLYQCLLDGEWSRLEEFALEIIPQQLEIEIPDMNKESK